MENRKLVNRNVKYAICLVYSAIYKKIVQNRIIVLIYVKTIFEKLEL